MLNYVLISEQLYQNVETYRKISSDENFFENVNNNIPIYTEDGLFVHLLCALLGSGIPADESQRFDELCQRYQTTKLSDIDEADANELWNEFHRLSEYK